MLVGCATLASLFPFVGTIVYLIVRPPEFLDDVRLRELEMQAAEARLASSTTSSARTATTRSRRDYLRCPSCMRKLKERCYSCGKPIDPAWRLCPFCEAETGAPTPPPRAAGAAGAGSTTRPRTTVGAEASPRAASRRAPNPTEGDPPMDRTLILVKPDAFARGLTGEIIARFERKGLRDRRRCAT